MGVFAGQGSTATSMALLWGDPAAGNRVSPGPKPGLSLDAIVAAAIAVADADGIGGLSMRAVAQRLRCTPMALYTYVPGKAELLDVMYDRAHAELAGEPGFDAGWRAAVTAWARRLRSFYLRHPWALQVSFARPVLGPHEQRVVEVLLDVLDRTGLPARTRQGVVAMLFHFVRGSAQTAADAQAAADATGMSDERWWADRAAALAAVAPDFAQRFPATMRLGGEGGLEAPPEGVPYLRHQAEVAFAIGLDILLDGVEAQRRADVDNRLAG
jgi:AcrR family transcriptional regulator